MRKLILVAVLFLVYQTQAHANFDFGATTYETADDILVVNSLGDQPVVSTFGTLGTNDWIPENAVKNELKLDGYSLAYDYNPTAAHDWGVYNQPLPTGGPALTKLTFAGLLGDPRKTQDVYVLTSEYNRLSAAGQATSIDNINTVNATQTTNISTLNSQVSNITTINSSQDNSINTLNNAVTNINTVNNNQSLAITNNANNISTVSQVQTTWNQTQDTEINNHTNQINSINTINDRQDQQIASTNSRVDDVSNRVSKLERTQTIIGGEVRLYDSRKWQVNAFLDYTTTRNTVDRLGVRFTYKLGKSYEEGRLDELERKIARLTGEKEKVETKSNSTTYYTGNGIGIKNNF